jgi:hypothetical protein
MPAFDSDNTGRKSGVTEFLNTARDAFVNSAFVKPAEGLSQIVDGISGSHLTDKIKAAAPDEAQTHLGSGDWHAQMIGSACGYAFDFLALSRLFGRGTTSTSPIRPSPNSKPTDL